MNKGAGQIFLGNYRVIETLKINLVKVIKKITVQMYL